MDLMSIRRNMMGVIVMASGVQQETFTISDTSLTNTTNIDTYFSNLIDGWDTEIIFIGLKNPASYKNRFVGCFSSYAASKGLTNVYRVTQTGGDAVQAINRNDYAINVVSGDVYIVCRLGTVS